MIEVVCSLIFDDAGRLLLLKRHSSKQGGNYWGFPGGKPEPGETPLRTVLRDTEEETGITLQDATYAGVHEGRIPYGKVRLTSFVGHVPAGTEVKINPAEHQAFRWYEPGELLTLSGLLWAAPSILRDYKLLDFSIDDPTLSDGSSVVLVQHAGPLRSVQIAGGLLAQKGKLLLIRKPGGWTIPKGHPEGAEALEQTAVRELREETGREAAVLRRLGVVTRPSREDSGELVLKDITVFLMRATGKVHARTDEDSAWVPLAAALHRMRYPQEAEFLREHLVQLQLL